MSDDANQKPPEAPREPVQQQAAPQPEPAQQQSAPAATGGTRQKFDFNTKVHELWNGKVSLVEAFWMYFFAVVIVMAFLGNILGPMSKLFAILSTIWAGFMIKPIWVAADAYKGPSHWALAAKIAAVGIGVTVVGDLLAF